jgi:hypothetical protein
MQDHAINVMPDAGANEARSELFSPTLTHTVATTELKHLMDGERIAVEGDEIRVILTVL